MKTYRSLPAFFGLLAILVSAPAKADFPLISSAAVAGAASGSLIHRLAQSPATGDLYAAGALKAGAGNSNIWLGRYDSGLVLLSSYTYDKAGFDDMAFAVAVDTATNDVFAAGYVSSGSASSSRDVWLARFNSSLVLQSSVAINGSASDRDEVTCLRVSSGIVFVVGLSSVTGGKGFWLARFDTNFVLLSSANYYQNSAEVWDFLETAGGVFVAGSRAPTFLVSGDTWIGKFDSNLVFVASATYNGPSSQTDQISGLAEDGSGGVYAVGIVYSATLGDQYIAHYDSNLVRVGSTTVNGPGNLNEILWGVTRTAAGTILVAGTYGQVAGLGGPNIYLAEYDSNLAKLSSTSFSSSGNAQDWGYAVLVGANQDVYAAGYATNAGSQDMWLGRFSTNPAYGVLPAGGFAGVAQSSTSILWSWTDASSHETGYRVMSGAVNVSGDLAANATTWLQTGLTANTTSGSLLVRAFNAGGTADSGSATRYALSDPPNSITATFFGSSVALSWPTMTNPAGTRWAVERGTDGVSYASQLYFSSAAAAFTDAGLGAQTTYYYRIRSANGDGLYSFHANSSASVFTGGAGFPGCTVTNNVGSGQYYATISTAVAALPATLTGNVCVVIRDGATYAEQVTVQGFTNNGFSITILADPASGLAPIVSPPLASTAAFLIANASVNVLGIDVAPTNAMPYGLFVSSAHVQVSSVNVKDASGKIATAGIAASSWTTVSYTSVTVGGVAATGIWLPGSVMTSVSYSTAAAANANAFALRLTGASFNTITGVQLVNLPGTGASLLNSNSNVISLSSIACDNLTGSNAALYLTGSSSNTVTQTYLRNSYADAIKLASGSNYNAISQSTAVLTGAGGQAAIGFSGSHYNSVTGCMLTAVGGLGINLGTSNWNTISLTTMSITGGTGRQALLFNVASSNTVTQCHVSNPDDSGAEIWNGSAYNLVSQSVIVGGPSANLNPSGVHIVNGLYNTITQSRISGPGAVGVTFNSWADRNTISLSTITGGATGIGVNFVGGGTNTVTGSYIQGAYGAITNGARGTTIDSSLIVATDASGNGVRVMYGQNCTLAGNAIQGGVNGSAIVLDLDFGGALVFSSNTVMGARYGVFAMGPAAGATLSIASMTFQELAPGATAIRLYGLNPYVSTFSAASFDASVAVNFDAGMLSSPSRITMSASTGPRAGSAYEYDPNSVVDWGAPLPSVPASLTASGVGLGAATLSWASGGNPAGTVYALERSTGTGFGLLRSSTALSFSDLPLTSASTYYYRVNARNADLVVSAYTSTITVVTFPTPVYPVLTSVTPSSAATGTSAPAAVVGAGFDASAVLTLERTPVDQGAWTATGSFTNARMLGTLTKLRDGRVLLAGGQIEGSAPGLAYADLYDPASGTWTPTNRMVEGRNQFASVLLPDGRVLAAGGTGPSGTFIKSAEIYDPVSSSWTAAASMLNARNGFQMAVLADGRVLAAGGWDGASNPAAAEIYDPAANTWSSGGSMALGRVFPTMTTLRNGKILVTGDSGAATTTAELYDPAGNSWAATGSMNVGRFEHQAVMLPDGRVLVAGGRGASVTNTAEVYDPATGLWTATSPMASARFQLGLIAVSGVPLAIAGQSTTTAVASTDIYDAALNSWRAGPSLAAVRYNALTVVLDDGKILVAGGRTGGAGAPNANTSELLIMPAAQIAATAVSVPDALHVNGTLSLAGAATGYWDVVVRESGGRTGRLSGGVNVTVPPSAPNAPTAFAGAALSTTSILWSWTDNASTEIGYRVMAGAVNVSGDLAANTTTWTQAGLAVNTSSGSLFVQAFNLAGTADSGALARYSLAATPAGLAASGVGLGAATLSWASGGNPAGTVYALERSTGTGFGLRQSSTSLVFYETTLSAASTYYYRVRALNAELAATAYASSITAVSLPAVVIPAPASITPSSATTGTSLPAAVVGTGFDASAALSLEHASVALGSWTATGAFTQARFLSTLTKLRDGRALLAGGMLAGSANGLTAVDLYDPATGLWTAGPPLRQGRQNHPAVMLADGRVLVAGGFGPTGVRFASAEIYDPALSTWTAAAPMTTGRSQHSLALLPDGRVLAAGGTGTGINALSSAEIYDPVTDSWSAAAAMSAARSDPAMAVLGDGKVMISGGNTDSASNTSAQIYDPATNTWSAAGSMSEGRYAHQLMVLPNGKVLASGGGNSALGVRDTADVYDPATNGWTATGPLGVKRYVHAMVLVSGTPMIFGGENSLATLASSELYDVETNAWRSGPVMTNTRTYPRAAVLDDGRVLAAGGLRVIGGTNLNTAELLGAPTAQILATGVTVPDAQHVNGTFSLAGAATGYWDVVVRESGGRTGRLSGGLNVTVTPTAPSAPTAFAGTAQSTTSILWSWADNASTELGYRVMAGAVNVSGDLAANTTTWTQAGLAVNTSSGSLFVRAFNLAGTADSGALARYSLAATPSGLAASGVYLTSGTLSWNANGNPGGTIFQLERSTGTGFGQQFAGPATYYIESYLTPSTTYFYRVLALNGESIATAYSSTIAVVTVLAPALPGAAGTPVGTALGTSSASWTWALASGATDHYLFRPSDNSYLGSSASGPFVMTALSPNFAYGLRAAGVNFGGTGPLSSPATVYTSAAVPAAAAAASITSTTMVASWGLNGNPGSTVALLERSTDAVVYATLSSAAVVSYADADLLGCTTYYYRVRNLNGDGLATAYASFQGLTANTVPSPPSGLSAAANAGGTVSLSWGLSPTEGVTDYRLYWDGGTGTVSYGATLAVLGSTETAYTTGVLASSASYTFALRAAHRCGVVETAGALALSGAAVAAAAVRAAIKEPDSGRRINGDRVTILGELIAGTPGDVQQVLFQYKLAASTAWVDVDEANVNHTNPDFSFPYFVHADVTAMAPGSYDLRAVAYNTAGVPDPAPPAVRVVVDPITPDISESETVDGKIKKNQTVSNAVTSVVDTCGAGASDPAVRVTIPPGIVSNATATVSVIANPTITTAAPTGQTLVGSSIKIDLSNGQTALNGTAEITLTYPDTVLFPSLLQIYYLNEATGQWSRDFNSTVDTASRTVTGRTPHFSTFAIMLGTSFSADLSNVRAYPVPFKPNGANADEGRPFSAGDPNTGIIFSNLASGSEIRIYTMTGRLVASLDSPAISGAVRWDARNQDGRDVASGAYFAVISASGQKSVVKKLVIIR